MGDKPTFVCNLAAMSAEERARHGEVAARMMAVVQAVEERADGYAFRFAPEPTLCLLLAEFITRERLCCPFLRLTIEFEPDGGPLWLRLTGPAGVQPFLRAELGLDR